MNMTETKGRWTMHVFGKTYLIKRAEDGKQFSFRKKSRALTVGQGLKDGTMSFEKAAELQALDRAQYA